MKTAEAAPTHEARSPSPFRERVHALAAAHSTWRDGGGSRSPEQRQWIADLTEQGYRAVVVRQWEAAWDELRSYLAADNITATAEAA